jgi:hypothetical protein
MNTGPKTVPRPAVFLCSSDSRYDVLKRILPSVIKFWGSCPYTFYIGMNTCREHFPRVTPVLAPASHWHEELAAQLAQVPERHILVLRDAFLLCSPVDQPRLTQVTRNAISMDLPYLRLMPLGQSMTARIRRHRPTHLQPDMQPIPASHPSYCGLQATIWRKNYLESLLEKQQSLAEFEQQSMPEARHCALTHSPPIHYRQVIERDRWLPDASSLLKRAGLSADLGDRPVWSKSKYLRLCLNRMRETLFGASTDAEQALTKSSV